VRVEFIVRRNVAEASTVEMNTLRGTLRLSSPEATAFDLVGYPGHGGGLSNVATVLAELVERLDASKLALESERSPLPWAQRLGFLLELVEAPDRAEQLAQRVARAAKEYVPLASRRTVVGARRDARWKLLVNEQVEPDL
jgi:enoyl-CoA hydratase/carnithine racemase